MTHDQLIAEARAAMVALDDDPSDRQRIRESKINLYGEHQRVIAAMEKLISALESRP